MSAVFNGSNVTLYEAGDWSFRRCEEFALDVLEVPETGHKASPVSPVKRQPRKHGSGSSFVWALIEERDKILKTGSKAAKLRLQRYDCAPQNELSSDELTSDELTSDELTSDELGYQFPMQDEDSESEQDWDFSSRPPVQPMVQCITHSSAVLIGCCACAVMYAAEN